MPAEPLGPDLQRFIINAYYDLPAGRRWAYKWIMSQEWLDEIKKIIDPPPLPNVVLQLYGLPIEVRPDGGVPHLEWAV